MKDLDEGQKKFEMDLLDRLFAHSFALRADAERTLEQHHHANGFCSCNPRSGKQAE